MLRLCRNSSVEIALQFKPATINVLIRSPLGGRQQPCVTCNFSLEKNGYLQKPKWGIGERDVGNDGSAGNQSRNAGNEGGNAGDQGENAGNRGGNAEN